MNKWLIVMNKDNKIKYIKYFSKDTEMDNYINKIKFLKNLFIIEDSRDIIWSDKYERI